MQIFCFGDSITWGSWEKGGGWSDRLKLSAYEYVESHPGQWIEVYNLGIPGDNTRGLRERFSNETSQRIEEETEPFFIFAFGANDACFIPSQNAFCCPIEEFESNYRIVLAKAKKLSKTISLLTITPVNESSATMDDQIRKNEFVNKYNAVIERIAAEENIELIDVNKAYLIHNYQSLLCADGLHPNAAGHALIHELVIRQWDGL